MGIAVDRVAWIAVEVGTERAGEPGAAVTADPATDRPGGHRIAVDIVVAVAAGTAADAGSPDHDPTAVLSEPVLIYGMKCKNTGYGSDSTPQYHGTMDTGHSDSRSDHLPDTLTGSAAGRLQGSVYAPAPWSVLCQMAD